jgi:hypothetical protein
MIAGVANGRALAYLAHERLRAGFGAVYPPPNKAQLPDDRQGRGAPTGVE